MTKTKKNKIKGFCQICGSYGSLSSDHVPPQGCISVSAVEIESFRDKLNCNYQLPKYSQNGVKFRTICNVCNSERLGGNYDNEFKIFVNNVISYYRPMVDCGLVFPSVQRIEVVGQRLARAVIGHALAASIDINLQKPPEWAPFDEKLKEYFLDINLNIPQEISIYYWLYPNRKQLILKSFAFCELGNKYPVIGHLYKFYPLAFWITYKKPDEIKLNIDKLPVEKCYTINDSTETLLSYSNIPEINWPENPTGDNMILLNSNQLTKARNRRKVFTKN